MVALAEEEKDLPELVHHFLAGVYQTRIARSICNPSEEDVNVLGLLQVLLISIDVNVYLIFKSLCTWFPIKDPPWYACL